MMGEDMKHTLEDLNRALESYKEKVAETTDRDTEPILLWREELGYDTGPAGLEPTIQYVIEVHDPKDTTLWKSTGEYAKRVREVLV